MAIEAFALGLLALVSGLLGATAWFANRAGRNSARVATAAEDLAAAQLTAQRTEAVAKAAASTITDQEAMQAMRDGKA